MVTLGCDLASVDEDGTPNWIASTTQGALRFVGLRVAQGLTLDEDYAVYRRQLDEIGLPHFPYVLLTPGPDKPEDQIDHAVHAVQPLARTHFPIAIDIEGDRRGLSAALWRDWAVRAALHVESLIGVPPLLYTSRVYWNDPDGMNGLPAPELSRCLGWWKYYPYPTNASAVYDATVIDRLPPPATRGFGGNAWNDQWAIHQYQGDARGYPGFRSTVDLNRLHVTARGDRGGLVAWIQARIPHLTQDGNFGPRTEEAVQSFQTSSGIDSDGIVGLDTLQRLAWMPPMA